MVPMHMPTLMITWKISAEAAPKLVLVEGHKGGRPGLHVGALLVTHRADGGFTDEMRRIYGETD